MSGIFSLKAVGEKGVCGSARRGGGFYSEKEEMGVKRCGGIVLLARTYSIPPQRLRDMSPASACQQNPVPMKLSAVPWVDHLFFPIPEILKLPNIHGCAIKSKPIKKPGGKRRKLHFSRPLGTPGRARSSIESIALILVSKFCDKRTN